MATRQSEPDLTMSASVRRAVDVVRAAGEEVSDEAIEILERVEQGEIDTEEAVRLIIHLQGGQVDECAV